MAWTPFILAGATLLVGAGGVALTLWALLWDRAHGRRRCPKCWHDLTGVPGLCCPECGKTAKSERRLFRTRRRWRWAVAGFMILAVVSPSIPAYHRLTREGVTAFVPTSVLIAMARWGDARGGASDYGWSNWGRPNAANSDSGMSTWGARLLSKRFSVADAWAWQKSLAWRAAHDRMDADLNLDPPMARADMWQLAQVAAGIVYPAADPRCDDLLTVTLRGPRVGVVGMPLCVEVEGFGFSDDDYIATLETVFADGPISAKPIHTSTSRMRWALISNPGITPDVVVDLGAPGEAAAGVWVTVRLWKHEWGSSDEATRSAPPAAVRRIWLPIPILPRGEHRLAPVEFADGPFLPPLHEDWGGWVLERKAYQADRWVLYMPRLKDEAAEEDAVGMRVEILQGDVVVMRGRACAWNGQSFVRCEWGGGIIWNWSHSLEVELDPVASNAQAGPTADELLAMVGAEPLPAPPYRVRVIGDEEMAWWHRGATRYWKGEFVAPVVVR